ncbi:UTP--glucose-1-phosphate uridylyltransferase [Gammaproteobacteria bacterium]|nr:UTP--glucose-1-phosphate uridylyltransferase [Gammaproteobacteria bacterium]
MKVSKVIVPIAGLGTRMLPATKAIPKEMLPVVNKPIIQIVIEEIVDAGFKEIIFITHSSKSSVENHFDNSFELEATLEKRVKRSLLKEIKSLSDLNVSIQSIRQGHAQGLGHAISCAKNIIKKEPFAIVLPDMLLSEISKNSNLAKLKKEFEETGTSSILLGKIGNRELSNYGIAKVSKNKILKIFEKPKTSKAPSNLFIVGRYIFTNNFINYISKEKNKVSNEIELSDAIQRFINDSNEILFTNLNGRFYDCGSKLGYLKAIVDYALADKSVSKEFKSYLKKIK